MAAPTPEKAPRKKKEAPGAKAKAATAAFLAHLDEVLAELPLSMEQVNPHDKPNVL